MGRWFLRDGKLATVAIVTTVALPLTEVLADLDVVELGCGTAYVSAWLARRGARPVGVDVTPAQLATARRWQHEWFFRIGVHRLRGLFDAV